MLRTIARSIAILAVLVPLVASARTVPPGVNLHNGYILVINHVQYENGFTSAGLVRVNEKDEAHVGSAGSVVVNRCCILAGSHYVVELNYAISAGAREPVSVTPRLCNIRGIPFGYAQTQAALAINSVYHEQMLAALVRTLAVPSQTVPDAFKEP